MNIKLFPVMDNKDLLVPYELVMEHNAQAFANHMQNVDRLAERGGLSVEELYYVLNDEPYDNHTCLIRSKVIDYVVNKIEEYNKKLLDRVKEADKLGLRLCEVIIKTGSDKYEIKNAYFHRWFDGFISIYNANAKDYKFNETKPYVKALVEYEDGSMAEICFNNIKFTDRG